MEALRIGADIYFETVLSRACRESAPSKALALRTTSYCVLRETRLSWQLAQDRETSEMESWIPSNYTHVSFDGIWRRLFLVKHRVITRPKLSWMNANNCTLR